MDTGSKQASSIVGEANSKKLLSVILAFILATTLMVPHTAWADEGVGGNPNATAVAMIGETSYDTLQAAINAAKSTDVVALVADTTESVTIAKDQVVAIDLGTFTLTNADGKHTIANNGTLTIKGAGTVDNVSHQMAALDNDEGATATLDGGVFTRSKENGKDSADSGGNSFYAIRNHGAMTINKGVKVSQNGHYSSMVENGYQNANDSEQHEIEGNVPTLIINGGEFSGGLNTIKNDDCGKLVIADGSFTNVSQAALLNWSVAEVSGGTFDATESTHGVILNGMNAGDINKGELTITGGTFKAAADKPVVSQMGGSQGIGTVTVSGGSFSANVSDFCAEGYSCTLADGMYVVAETPAPVVAKIGEKTYETLQAAIDAAAKTSETVVLASDVVLAANGDSLVLSAAGSDVTLDLNGKTIDATTTGAKVSGGAKLTVKDSAKDGAINFKNYSFEIAGDTAYADGSAPDASKAISSTLTLESGTIASGSAAAIYPYGNGATLNVNGGAIENTYKNGDVDGGFAIAANGDRNGKIDRGGVIINIAGGTIKSAQDCAIYLPACGTANITGGTIEGWSGIEIDSGSLSIGGNAVVKSTYEGDGTRKYKASGDGNYNFGAALAIVSKGSQAATGYFGHMNIAITGGTIESASYYAIDEYNLAHVQNETNKSVAYIDSLSITGGTIGGKAGAILSDNMKGFVSGGTYSSDVTAYVADGLACSKISDNFYQIQKKIEIVDGNVEVQAPIVSEDNVPVDKPGVPEKDEALTNIAGSLGDALVKGTEPVEKGVIAGNKIESGDADINSLVKGAGEDETVSTTVVVTSVPVSEEAVDEKAAAAIKDAAGKDSDISFYDLSVKLVVEKKKASGDTDGVAEAAVTETAEPIPFKIKVDELVGKDVKVVRYHGDTAEVIDATVDYATGVVSFAGDKFSTYAVALSDANVTVTFDSNGGPEVAKAEVAKGGLVGAPAAPTREGYTFDGWYADEALTTAWDFDADRATADMTLYAKWTKATPDLPATASRLGGDDRYKTMALISKASFPTDGSCETVIIARGSEFPDALAASALAGVKGAQVLITETDVLTAETKAEIKRLGAKNAIVLGNEYSVSERTYNEIKSLMTGTTTRIGGETRYETAYDIYKTNTGWGKTAIVATGKKAADSLSISPIAYTLKAPIFLAAEDGTVSKDVLDAIAKGGFDRVIVLGDKYSVSDDTVAGIKKLVKNTERLGGADRYATSQLTADWAMKNCDFTCANAMLTAGRDGKYADALVASSLGANNASPLLLVDEGKEGATCIDKTLAANKADVEKAYVLGDKHTVSDELLKAIEKALA